MATSSSASSHVSLLPASHLVANKPVVVRVTTAAAPSPRIRSLRRHRHGVGATAAPEAAPWIRPFRRPRFTAETQALRSSEAEVEAAAVPRSVPVRVAYELQQAGHRYLDVRSEGEFSAGHPQGAVNIPYMYKNGSGLTKNTHFLEQVSRVFGKDDEIIVGCQSGKRSLMAATELCSAGFTAVTDIGGGFSSWRENGLPVIQ